MSTPHPEVDDLLEKVEKGVPRALDQLMDRYRAQLKTMVQVRMDRRLAARLDASDVVQEALATAHKRIPEYFAQQNVSFYVWLRSIAWNRLVDLHRRHVTAQRRTVTREERIDWGISDGSVHILAGRLAAQGKSPSQQAVRAELACRVRAALERLTETDREIVMLRHVEGLSVGYAASVLGISESAVKSRHFRAVEKLRNWLDE